MPQSSSNSPNDSQRFKNVHASDSFTSILNGVTNIKTGETLEEQQVYKDSIHYYIKGLDAVVHRFIREVQKKNSSIVNDSKFSLIKDLIHFYYLRASVVDKKLNETSSLLITEDILKQIREEITFKKQNTFTLIENTFDSPSNEIEFIGYDDVKSYFHTLFSDIVNKNSSVNFIRKVSKCKPVLIYGPPGMGKESYVYSLLKSYSKKYHKRLKLNFIHIDFTTLTHDSAEDYFRNILYTIQNHKKQNFIFLQNLEFVKKFDEKLSFKLIESFLCELETLNGYETIIIGLTSIPWYLPTYLRCRFYKRFFIHAPTHEQIKEFIRVKFSFLDMDAMYSEIASCFQNCVFKTINVISEELVSELTEKTNSLFVKECPSDEKDNFVPYKRNYFNYKLFSDILKDRIYDLVMQNTIPSELLDKYEDFSKTYDTEYSQL